MLLIPVLVLLFVNDLVESVHVRADARADDVGRNATAGIYLAFRNELHHGLAHGLLAFRDGIDLEVIQLVMLAGNLLQQLYNVADTAIVGKKLGDAEKVVIIEDVMTSGKALREVMPKLKETANVDVTGMVITVDRMEKALDSDLSAVEQAYKDFGVKVYSIVNINDIIDAIRNGVVDGKEYLDKMLEYRNTYGVNNN